MLRASSLGEKLIVPDGHLSNAEDDVTGSDNLPYFGEFGCCSDRSHIIIGQHLRLDKTLVCVFFLQNLGSFHWLVTDLTGRLFAISRPGAENLHANKPWFVTLR